jgi:hypothetical protein
MPSCTGNQKSSGCWVCPLCAKRKIPLNCRTVVQDINGRDQVAPCTMPCRFFTVHFDNPGLLILHLEKGEHK